MKICESGVHRAVIASSVSIGHSPAQASAAHTTAMPLQAARPKGGNNGRIRRKALVLAMALALGAIGSRADVNPALPVDSEYPAGIIAAAETDPSPDWLSNVAPTATRAVTNCDNSGPGSLRAVVAAASSGDVIDLRELPCQIRLNSSIVTSVDSLTFIANRVHKYAYHIQGNGADRIITHTGTGTLNLFAISIGGGKKTTTSSTARGGCVYSSGTVHLDHARLGECTAASGAGKALGGAIYAKGWVDAWNSTITSSTASSSGSEAKGGAIFGNETARIINSIVSSSTAQGDAADGGGVFAYNIDALNLTLAGNRAIATGANMVSRGGGAFIRGLSNSFLGQSAVFDNHADAGAALYLPDTGSASRMMPIDQVTISGNTSTAAPGTRRGGALTAWTRLRLRNSTISGNRESALPGEAYGAGVSIGISTSAEISSSIISGNLATAPDGSTTPSDLNMVYRVTADQPWIMSADAGPMSPLLGGSHNLFGAVQQAVPPADTIFTHNPGLGPLRDNGGPTRTMAVLPSSPARDRGFSNGFTTDQRGTGFPRVVGRFADIGAFELGDAIFSNGFQRP